MLKQIINQWVYTVKNLKKVAPEQWIQRPDDATPKWQHADLTHLNIKFYRNVKRSFKNQLQPEKAPQPISPVMGPMTVQNPELHDKIYRWCSCGQSLKQPICDGSHKGTSFKPFKFTVQEKVSQIRLCGCKLTNNKPFCDGQSCKVDQLDQQQAAKIE